MKTRLVPFLLALCVFALDRLTKVWIESHVSVWETRLVIPRFFNIVHTRNRGAVFGLFGSVESPWRDVLLVGMSLVVLVLLAVLLWRQDAAGLACGWGGRLALALVLGGAIGNLHDRIAYRAVTDFLEFYIGEYRWPVFNVADSAITVGAALLLLDLWRSRRLPVRA